MPTLCLNSIVKNESAVIIRMLESVVGIIDTYCICDTGSTDDTIEKITNFFNSRNIQGKIIQEPFVNFEHNRNIALGACLGMSDFILFIDADMILEVKNFNKDMLEDNHIYSILQGTESFYYPNVRIIKNDGKSKYIGVTHEYVDCPPYQTMTIFNKLQIFITDIGDGGSKSNKAERDIRLLKGDLEQNENNPRTLFYLANTYFDTNMLDESIPYYEKRIEVGGWEQEIWYSNYRLGEIYKRKNDNVKAVEYWMKAYDVIPLRLENMFKIINLYRIEGNHKRAFAYIKLIQEALHIHKENNIRDNYLFMENDIYNFLIDYEYIILGYYNGIKNANLQIMSILQNATDQNLIASVLNNIRFYPNTYTPKSTRTYNSSISDIVNIGGVDYNIPFTSSSPCIIKNPNGNGYIMNIRLHNYILQEDNVGVIYVKMLPTSYDSNNIIPTISMNHLLYLNENFDIVSKHITYLKSEPKILVGVEDIRIFYSETNKSMLYIGTATHDKTDISIVRGTYDDNIMSNMIPCKQSFKESGCEKNWVYVDFKGATRVIYNWYPLTVCDITNDNELVIVYQQNTPKIFSYLRGSSCGYRYKNEIWFVCHSICYDVFRNYYDMIVVLDSETLQVIKSSPYFKYSESRVQYTLGSIVNDDTLILSYSIGDNTTNVSVYDKKTIESSMVNYLFKTN